MKRKENEYEIPFDVEEKLYIIPERYKEQKNRLKDLNKDCRNETMADMVHIGSRMYAEYINGKHPIPEDRLSKIGEYMGVEPDWLVGKTDKRIIPKYYHDPKFSIREHLVDGWLLHYLTGANIQSYSMRPDLLAKTDPDTREQIIDKETGGDENPYFKYREIYGVVLSYNEYQALMEELRLVIGFTADRFVKNVVASRNGFE